MADTCSYFPEVQGLRENILGRGAVYPSPQQRSKRPALVADLNQRAEGVKTDGSDQVASPGLPQFRPVEGLINL